MIFNNRNLEKTKALEAFLKYFIANVMGPSILKVCFVIENDGTCKVVLQKMR